MGNQGMAPEELRLIDAIESLSDLIGAGSTVEDDGVISGDFDPFTFTVDEATLVADVIDNLKMVRASLFGDAERQVDRPDPIVIILEGDLVQGVGTRGGGGLSRPIVILDYDASEWHDEPNPDAGVFAVPQGDGDYVELAYIRRPGFFTLNPVIADFIDHLIETGQV